MLAVRKAIFSDFFIYAIQMQLIKRIKKNTISKFIAIIHDIDIFNSNKDKLERQLVFLSFDGN